MLSKYKEEATKRFQAYFNIAPETREAKKEQEKRRMQIANRLGQIENEIRILCEKVLPFGLLDSYLMILESKLNEKGNFTR